MRNTPEHDGATPTQSDRLGTESPLSPQPTTRSPSYGNLDEYADPELYDIENRWDDDLPLLLTWARRQGGPLVDLACGTGRVTLPLAEAGFEVFGVDIHAGMLTRARLKAVERGLAVTWLEQDCARLALPVVSPFMCMCGHAFQAFLTNDAQDALLRSINAYLRPGGVFIFDTRMISADEMLQPREEQPWRTLTDQHGREMVESTIASYNPLTQIQEYITIRRFTAPDGTTGERRDRIALRYTHPRELHRLLNQHGFEVVALFGDWDETPLTADGYHMVCIARREGSAANAAG
jgi:SAM-dependent methyltransferase